MPTMTRFTRRLAGALTSHLFGCARHIEEDGCSEGALSRRESDVSCGTERAHQQREDAICQGC